MPDPQVTFHLMLKIEGPGVATRLEDLVRDRYSVGRGGKGGETPDFAVPDDAFLSRVHCRIHKTGDTYAVENLSPNGTRLNGKTIDKIVALKHKDKISVGESTNLEFLAATDDERAQLLQVAAGAKAGKSSTGPKRPFYKSPIFIGVMVLYAIVILAYFAMNSDEGAPSMRDPGAGPYFRWMRKAPLQWDNNRETRIKGSADMWEVPGRDDVPEDMRKAISAKIWEEAKSRDMIPDNQRKEIAEEAWKKTLTAHGGPALARGSHAYTFAIETLHVLGLLHFPSLDKATTELKDEKALAAEAAIADLEARVSQMHELADQYKKSDHTKAARDQYKAILEAVPSRYEAIHRFAQEQFDALSNPK